MNTSEEGRPIDGPQEGPAAGEGLIRASVVGTAVFVVVALAAAVLPDALAVPAAVIDGAFFAAGCALFLWAFAVAVSRSRTVEISVMGVYFLAGGSAPAPVRRRLLGAFAVQVVVAVATASVRLYTPLAFGILVPVFGLGAAGLWGARYGTFPARRPSAR